MSDAARQILVLTKSDDEPVSFTPVRTEADRIEKCVPLAAHAI